MNELKVYVAGKVSPDSGFGTHAWRDKFCEELSQKSGIEIQNLDPIKEENGEKFDLNDSKYIVGKDASLIEQSEVVIVYLSDDISVGGSQEMLIAKYYKKPLFGLAPKEGKFNKSIKEFHGQSFADYLDPFVKVVCDVVASNTDELAESLKNVNQIPPKSINVVDEAKEYYQSKNQ